MFIHLGGEKIISTSELVAILDISMTETDRSLEHFLSQEQQPKNVEHIGEEEPKSVVVTPDKIYYSPISSVTLKKRANQVIPN